MEKSLHVTTNTTLIVEFLHHFLVGKCAITFNTEFSGKNIVALISTIIYALISIRFVKIIWFNFV